MYQVIQTRSINEPWWFFEDWRDDIVIQQNFDNMDEACVYFEQLYEQLSSVYEQTKKKSEYCIAFWNEQDKNYCEACCDDTQIYTGLILLNQENQVVNN